MNEDSLINLAAFDGHTIRQMWWYEQWYFSVVDVIRAITGSADPGNYWSRLKARVNRESHIQLVTFCTQLKLPANDGKFYKTDCANTENMLRIIQYIPSKEADQFKQWLAQVGAERIEELNDPATGLDEWKERAVRSYVARGYAESWARNRVDSLIARSNITDEWAVRGITAAEYPILIDRLHMGTFGLGIRAHMEFKGFVIIRQVGRYAAKGDLGDGMTDLELTVDTFAQNLTRGLHRMRDSRGYSQIARDIDDAAALAELNRREIELLTGEKVVSPVNMLLESSGDVWSLLPAPDRYDGGEE